MTVQGQLHNPPAYPCSYNEVRQERLETVTYTGMSLRDYFAGQALLCLQAIDHHDSLALARVAYEVADAMLTERDKGR